MTRRDTIIITTLVNAGLLACLFVTATRQEEVKPDFLTDAFEVAEAPSPSKDHSIEEIAFPYISDEVDQALKEFLPPQEVASLVLEDQVIENYTTEANNQQTLPSETIALKSKPSLKESAAGLKFVEIKVKKGDFLEKIAKANGTTIGAIKEASNLKSDKLVIGQVLKVPVGDITVREKPAAIALDMSGDKPVFYTVQSGDNPWKIAKKFHVRFEDILKLNNMTEEKSKNLKVGQELRVK